MKVIVDVRESRLHEYLLDMLPEIEVTTAALDIGDVEIAVEEHAIRLIFERKSEKDLAASIKDGRYREQKLRMINTTYKHHCTYIIENPNHWESHACPPASYTGAIFNTMYRDGIHVVIVPNTHGTAEWIARVAQKCKENPAKFVATNSAECEYLSMCKVKSKKQDNIDVKTCYQLQLCQIPGISAKLASSIADVYPSWRALYTALDAKENADAKVRLLSQIPLIGAKKAKTFLEFIQE